MPEFAGEQSELLQQQLEKEVVRALPSLRTLPGPPRGHRHAAAERATLTTRQERYSGADREVVDAWIDRLTFAAIGIIGMLSAGLLLLARGGGRARPTTTSDDAAGLRLPRHHRDLR